MTKSLHNSLLTPNVYDETLIQELRDIAESRDSWVEARSDIANYLGVTEKHVDRLNRKYDLECVNTGEDDLVVDFGDLNAALEELQELGSKVVGDLSKKAEKKEVDKSHLPNRKIKRLFLDIEVSPDIVLSWRIGYKINLDHSNILKERAIICVGYKWEHESEAKCISWDENQDDKAMLVKVLEIVNEADEAIMHNGDRFDMPWLKTRCLFHGLEPLPEYKTVDTLQWARKHFYFNSNKLDYIARFLGLGGKIKTEFGLWKEVVLDRSTEAMDKMAKYCKQDVLLLEKVWQRLSRAVNQKTHVGVLAGKGKWTCPHCGSENVKVSKERVTAKGSVQYQMVCNDCGRYFTVSESVYRSYLEAKSLGA
jgi:predicted PolB exonuclease-like 3'-5' exonuclease